MSHIFKDGSNEVLFDYRLQSVLTFFSHLFEKLYMVCYISVWMVMDLSIDIKLALDHSIQLLHAYYQIPMSGIRTSTTAN